MKTQLHNYMLNLFEENRCIYMSPMGTSPEKKAPATETAEQQLQNLTPDEADEAVKNTRDRIGRITEAVSKSLKASPKNKKLQDVQQKLHDLHQKLGTLDKHISGSTEKYAKVVGKTISQVNTIIDSKIPGVKKQIIESSAKVLAKTDISASAKYDQKWGDSVVNIFSMMKVKDQVKVGKLTFKKDGNEFSITQGKVIMNYKLTTDGSTWKVMDQAGGNLSYRTNPLLGVNATDKTGAKFKVAAADVVAPKTRPGPSPKKVAGTKPEKAKETKEGPTKQLLSDTFKIISNPDVHGQKLTPQQLSTLQSFTKSVPKGGVTHFKHGNTETYVARSVDGAVWKISTIVKDSHGDTSSGIKYYAPRVTSKITHKLPKQYERKVAFKDTPAFTIKAKSRVAAARKPKKYDTGEPTPDPKILAMFKNQEKKAQQEAYLSKEMKTWVTGVKKAVTAAVKRLGWFSKSKALAKKIQAEKGIPFNEAAKRAVQFKSKCEGCDSALTLKTMTPAQVIARVKSITKGLPPKLKADYDAKFNINAGETRLASLKKGIPPSAIPKENLARPKTDTETVDNAKGYKNLVKEFGLNKMDINDWTGTGKDAIELKLIYGLKNGKSPVMKDKHGNEFYLKISGGKNSDTMSVHIKNKGEKSFKLAFKETDGAMELPAVDATASPKKTAKKGVSKGAEAYDKNMEKNVKTLMSKFNKLKPNGLGVKFKMKNGATLSVFRKNKDTCYAVDENGEKASFSLKDGAEVRNIAQILAKNPKFESEVPTKDAKAIAKALKISPREKADIKESVGVLKKMLEGKNIRTVMKSNKQDLKDYLAHIGGVHKRKNTPGQYNIAKGYTLNVSKKGTVKLKHKGEGTLTYPKNADA